MSDAVPPPDVTVIVAVYNTMPYLTECLDSLVAQTIGLDRMQVVTVDDGSTDSGPAELARFASLYPDTFTVITQENSGGPAAPQNRGLERATGRYVFMLGSDDYLGPEALERLVAAADEQGSDVVLGRMVGVNGRVVPKSVFARGNRHGITLTEPALCWALSDTKLFRRAHLDRFGIRYPEDLSILCDHPLTLEALLRADRVSVLGDYPYYYAVSRADLSNITFRGRPQDLLRATERSIRTAVRSGATAAELAAVVNRYLVNEISTVLTEQFPAAAPEVQRELLGQVGALVEEFADEAATAALPTRTLLRLLLAKAGEPELLLETLRWELEPFEPPLLEQDGRIYANHPCLSRPDLKEVHALCDLTRETWLDVTASWEGTGLDSVLAVTARSPLADYAEAWGAGLSGRLVARGGTAAGTVAHEASPDFRPATDGPGTRFDFRFPMSRLVADGPTTSGAWAVRVEVEGDRGPVAVTVPPGTLTQLKMRSRHRYFRVSPAADGGGNLVISVAPIRATRVIAQRLRRLRAIGRK